MNAENVNTVISNFMKSPLVSWAKTFQDEERKALEFRCLCDGVFLSNIWLEIDPHPPYHGINLSTEDLATRIRNLDVLVHNIKAFYEEVLGQMLVTKIPDILTLARNQEEHSCVGEMESLLLLILGCAVQCERKEYFIEVIKSMDLEIQHKIVDYIQKITDNPETVWSNEWNELGILPPDDQEHMYNLVVQHLRNLVRDRDELAQKLINVSLQNLSLTSTSNPLSPSSTCNLDKSHLIVELADVKSRLRKLQQEVEEKNEGITELKEELEISKDAHCKLRQENLELIQDARTAKTYRDEIDILKERVRKVDRLESEIQRYKDKMNELEFYKSRVEELREDNRILVETKTMLEEQLEGSRKRAEQVVELEAEILKYCSQINELTLEREADRERIQQLLEENTQLHIDRKASMEELAQLQSELSHTFTRSSPLENHSLLEQLNTDAQTRVLQLELENQRLRMLVESLSRSPSFEIMDFENYQDPERRADLTDSSNLTEKGIVNTDQVSNLVKENKALKEKNNHVEKEIEELKCALKKIAPFEVQCQEMEKLIEELRHNVEMQKNELSKCEQLEHNIISLGTENQKLQRVVDINQQKISELQQDLQAVENENQKLNNNVECLKLSVRKYHDLERETTNLETLNHRMEQEMKGLEKENQRLKYAVEAKDTTIEEYASRVSCLDRENKQLQKEIENLNQVAAKVRELERENKDLSQQTAVDKKSLEALRQDLVSEKIANQKLNSEINKVKSLKESSESALEIISQDHENQLNELKTADRFVFGREDKKTQDISPFHRFSQEDNKFELSSVVEKSAEDSSDANKQSLEKENLLIQLPENVSKDEANLLALKEELRELKADVLELEKRNSAIEEENFNLSNQTSSLKDQNGNLKSQLESVEQHLSSVLSQNSTLQSRLAKLEVEITLTSSQNSTLSSQNSAYQAQITNLEEQIKQAHQQYAELESKNRCLLSDHESLQRLHEQLTNDYESLVKNHSTLKSIHKNLKAEHSSLKEKLQAALFSQEEVMKLREVLEEDTSKADGKLLNNLRSEHIQLKDQLRSLKETHGSTTKELKSLQAAHKMLKMEHNELKLKHTALQGELSECQNETSALDIEVSKLTSCCELLSQKNAVLEEEQQTLMSHVTLLLTQYHELLFQVVSEHGQFRKDENNFREKLRELCHQKEKLEQKIIDHCHKLQKSPKRKHLQLGGTLRMRRTRSAFLKVKQNDNISSDNSTDSSLYCSMRRPKKPGGWAHLNRGSLTNAEDSSQEDHIPVRDVGLGKQHSATGENSASVVSGQKMDKSSLDSGHHPGPQHTTVENNMTLNLITNLTNPEKKAETLGSSPQFSRSHSSQQISPYHLQYPRSVDYTFNPISSAPASNNLLHNLGQPKPNHLFNSGLGSDSGSNPESLDASDTSKFSRNKSDRTNDQTSTHNKEKCAENSVWYEYGCV